MFKQKIKKVSFILFFIFLIISITKMSYASNEGIKIVKNDSDTYLIYIKNGDNLNFEFAFSNDKNAEKTSLSFVPAGKDSKEAGAKNIAFIDSKTKDADYLWIKNGEEFILEAIGIDII